MQSKLDSLLEAASAVVIKYFVSVGGGVFIYPLFDSDITLTDNMGITLCFTLLSFVVSYFIRRIFNWLHTRKVARMEG
jgi:hypothetical protein